MKTTNICQIQIQIDKRTRKITIFNRIIFIFLAYRVFVRWISHSSKLPRSILLCCQKKKKWIFVLQKKKNFHKFSRFIAHIIQIVRHFRIIRSFCYVIWYMQSQSGKHVWILRIFFEDEKKMGNLIWFRISSDPWYGFVSRLCQVDIFVCFFFCC